MGKPQETKSPWESTGIKIFSPFGLIALASKDTKFDVGGGLSMSSCGWRGRVAGPLPGPPRPGPQWPCRIMKWLPGSAQPPPTLFHHYSCSVLQSGCSEQELQMPNQCWHGGLCLSVNHSNTGAQFRGCSRGVRQQINVGLWGGRRVADASSPLPPPHNAGACAPPEIDLVQLGAVPRPLSASPSRTIYTG